MATKKQKEEKERKPPVRRDGLKMLQDVKRDLLNAMVKSERDGDSALAVLAEQTRTSLSEGLRQYTRGKAGAETESTASVEASTH